jgi:phosphoribosylformylglycinamidine synthase subunit PurS
VRVTVLVRPKDGILDPQGQAIDRSLKGLGYASRGVRAGKVFDLDLDVASAADAQAQATKLADAVLANALIEQFEVIVHG